MSYMTLNPKKYLFKQDRITKNRMEDERKKRIIMLKLIRISRIFIILTINNERLNTEVYCSVVSEEELYSPILLNH